MKTLLLLLLCTCALNAQTDFQNPDKVYLHLDKNLYAQGDTIWVKGYAMERGTNKPSDKSHSIHVQMINEKGIQVGAYKFLTVGGEAVGQIELLGVQEPGFYQLVAHTGYMKNFSPRFFYKTTIEVRERVRRRSISTLFDKSKYAIGDTAEVTFSVIDQNQSPVPNARFIYEYILDDELVSKDGVKCYDDGSMTIRIPIEGTGQEQNAKLKLSYLPSELDVHRTYQEVIIPLANRAVHLSFFPEGGDLIRGMMSKVAFKANNAEGKPVDIKGELYLDGKRLETYSSIHQGMGLFALMVEQGDYTFKITSPQGVDSVFHLPKVKEMGYKMSYLAQNESTVYLSIGHNLEEEKACKLWVGANDKLLSTYDVTLSGETRVPVPKASLPGGIVCFTISDEQGQPQAERLVYIDMPSAPLELSLSNTQCQTRSKMDLNVQVEPTVWAHLSCAVVDSAMANSPNFNTSNIMAYAQLESELKGYIYDVNQYLGDDRSVGRIRDLLLMTHGWRRFEWLDNNESLSQKEIHNFDRVYGEVTRLGKPYPKANIGAYLLGSSIAFAEFESDEEGRFFLDPSYEKRDYKDLMIFASTQKRRSGVQLKLINTDTVGYHRTLASNANELKRVRQGLYEKKEEEIDAPSLVEEPFMSYHTYALQEFEVSAEKTTWDMSKNIRQSREMMLGTQLDDFESFEWLLMQVSNEVILEGGIYQGSLRVDPHDDPSDPLKYPTVKADRAVISTACADRTDVLDITTCASHRLDEVLLVFDGEHNRPGAMIYLNDEAVGYYLSTMDFLTKEDIKAVVLYDGIDGYDRFGVRAYYGAIMVYTYDKDIWDRHRLKNNQALYGNFVKARRFPEQLYENEEQSKRVGDDSRVTLHWEPFLITDIDGQAKVSFYTGDIPGKKQVVVQGFDDEGNLYYQTASFYVEDILDRR